MQGVLIFVTLLCCGYGYEDKTIMQYLRDNAEYSELVRELTAFGLDSSLETAGPLTIFAPTNTAFQTLNMTEHINNPNVLEEILKYHVITEFLVVPMVTGRVAKTTIEGQDLILEPSSGTLLINNDSLVDQGPNNDIIVNNGVVQPIDTVLLPPILAVNNIAQVILKEDTMFKDLFLALLLADLTTTLEGGDYTVFAPIDSAFAPFQSNLLDPSNPNAQKLYQEVLKYHVAPGGRKASQLSDGQVLYTLHGLPLNITVSPAGVEVNNAKVIQSDLLATNGVVHAIDTLLIPADLQALVAGTG